ncbi:MAG: ankyrin repeat domain-containing protein [Amoebophilaceae bacterium]|nr:ankyrin repeat domain-containing protein [Amoebophilaceae bacterium]
MVTLLLSSKKVNLNHVDAEGNTPFHLAIHQGSLEMIQLFIESERVGEDADFTLDQAVHYAVLLGSLDVIKLFFQFEKKFKNINRPDCKGDTVLHNAVFNDHVEMVQFLLQSQTIDINALDGLNRTPFLLAIAKGNLDIIKWFIQPNIQERLNLNSTDVNGYTALHAAIMHNHIALAKWIIKSGRIDLIITDYQVNTPLDLAKLRGDVDLINLLTQAEGQHNLP